MGFDTRHREKTPGLAPVPGMKCRSVDVGSATPYLRSMKSVVSTKGQVTLPAEVRAKLGLTVGTAVQFELREGGVLLRKGGGALHPVDRVFGRLKLNRPVDTLLDEMRGPGPARKAARRRASGRW
jgi:antitoxin PrlF